MLRAEMDSAGVLVWFRLGDTEKGDRWLASMGVAGSWGASWACCMRRLELSSDSGGYGKAENMAVGEGMGDSLYLFGLWVQVLEDGGAAQLRKLFPSSRLGSYSPLK